VLLVMAVLLAVLLVLQMPMLQPIPLQSMLVRVVPR
jgi:hypothetical protein